MKQIRLLILLLLLIASVASISCEEAAVQVPVKQAAEPEPQAQQEQKIDLDGNNTIHVIAHGPDDPLPGYSVIYQGSKHYIRMEEHNNDDRYTLIHFLNEWWESLGTNKSDLQVLAPAETPWANIEPVMIVALKAGITEYLLVANTGDELLRTKPILPKLEKPREQHSMLRDRRAPKQKWRLALSRKSGTFIAQDQKGYTPESVIGNDHIPKDMIIVLAPDKTVLYGDMVKLHRDLTEAGYTHLRFDTTLRK